MYMLVLAGIDYSMSCPAICFHFGDNFSFENCEFYYLTKMKKYEGFFNNNKIHGHFFPEYFSDEQRYDNISNYFLSLLEKHKCESVAIEGYSMGSKGQVFNIAENTGLLKHKLWKNNMNMHIYAPKSVKKYATDNGNANKNDMYNAFLTDSSIDICKKMDYNKTNIDSPIGDIVDSYFICKYLFFSLQQ